MNDDPAQLKYGISIHRWYVPVAHLVTAGVDPTTPLAYTFEGEPVYSTRGYQYECSGPNTREMHVTPELPDGFEVCQTCVKKREERIFKSKYKANIWDRKSYTQRTELFQTLGDQHLGYKP